MTKLSVNINKLATLRNARGGNNPDLLHWAKKIQDYGAHGITVHPRPDERHIRYADVYALKEVVHTEFNIEGYPNEAFLNMVKEVKPDQVTLVPDSPDVLTSNAGWDVLSRADELKEIVGDLKSAGLRVSLFMDPDVEQIEALEGVGTHRVELYTEAYATDYKSNKEVAVLNYKLAAEKALEMKMGLNAGHDLDLENLKYFSHSVSGLLEVSIGHALVCDALIYGMENTVNMYLNQLR
jgi:pyridoxine 5-phosphate synthase